MSFRKCLLILYISLNTFFTDAQNVQTPPPKNVCTSSTAILDCPNDYVPIVRSASFGIAQRQGSCQYEVGDCIADAMSIMSCPTDSTTCNIYITRRKLSTCNDHFADYAHIEYDCVPISMNDSTKMYNICQNARNITTDHGIIHSPGYPTQFQTTTSECLGAIDVPNNKTIRLWLSDLSIGSTSTNCAEDHLYVVDSVQAYRDCGTKRLVYPYLCSSRIFIQYLITTAYPGYRGLRMYFEIVDRLINDGCPDPGAIITPIPATTPSLTTIDPDVTTNPPIYVILGIASPVRNVQLCKGDSYLFQCPNNYVVTIIKNIFGTTTTDQCEPYDEQKHCAISAPPSISCRQSCSYFYGGQQYISTCNKIAAYEYIEYQCIPTNTEIVSNSSCPNDGSIIPIQINEKGRFQSYNYPYLQTSNCTYRITTKPGYVMRFYSLDISLNSFSKDCQANKLLLMEKDAGQSEAFCKEEAFSLIYSSCSNEVDLQYTITNSAELFTKGVELYIESQARPTVWDCGKPLPTSNAPPTVSTPPYVTRTVPPLQNETTMSARDEIEHDICFNSTVDDPCPRGYTFMIVGAFYGVKSSTSNKCGFVQGDCAQEALSTITQCRTDLPNCRLTYSNKQRLTQCSDEYADYLHITSQCIPSVSPGSGTTIQTYDICDTNNDIRDINGVVISPNFPTFQPTNIECKRTITDILDRVLRIWLNELSVSSGGQRNLQETSNSNEPDLVIYKISEIHSLNEAEQIYPSIRDTCTNDYLLINTPHIAYLYCGTRKLAIAPICARSVDIYYKSTSTANLFYKGFKFYFEWIEKPPSVICGGTIPTGNTTTPTDEVLPIWAQNLELSPVLSKHICLGSSATLRCPRGSDYVLSIIDSSYGVTGSGLCEIPTSSHCRQEASLGLTCAHSCFVEYSIPKSLILCGSKDADYLSIDYECIPTRLPDNEIPIDICATTPTDTIAIDTGMIVSPQYPAAPGTHSCSKKIQTLDNKLWMVFIVDLYLKEENNVGQCDTASLTIYDGKDKIIRCGLHQPELVLISCSDIIEFQYVSTPLASDYRGFKVYFKTIDVPADWACKPTGYITTTTTTTIQPSTTVTLVPPSFHIVAYGGTTNNTRQYCTFPFIYQGNPQATCSRLPPPGPSSGQHSNDPWCSLTSNFDTDGQWGFCDLGVTEPTIYNICPGKTQLLLCPSGYIIDVLTADYAAKPDGSSDISSCVYDQNDCFQSDTPTIQSQCAGLAVCPVFHSGRPLSACQNRQSAYYHIDYTCVPNEIPEIPTYDICTSGSIIQNNTHRGFIVSPKYPVIEPNIDCTFNLQVLKNHQDIYLYIVDMDLSPPNPTGQVCMDDRLIVTADNAVNEMCGRSYTNLLAYTCHQSITLQLIRTSSATGRGVKLYFEFRDKPPYQLCPSLPSTTTAGSTLKPITTTSGPLPNYYPDPSPRMFKSLCFPDYSGLLGEKNFECPTNYILLIHRAFYGKGPRCDYTSGDCTSEAYSVYQTCAGKQSCSITFINEVHLLECQNQTANYLFVEYQCLPTPAIASNNGTLCTGQIDHGAGISGVLTSPSYPTYTQTQCPNNTLSSLIGSNLVIYMYLLDLNIGPANIGTGNCSNDYLLLSYQCKNQLYHERLCGTQHARLLFSTCISSDQIFVSYNLLNQGSQTQGGFALLYHLLPESEPVTSASTPGITTTTQKGTSPVTPSGPGPISTITERTSSCVPHAVTIECKTPGYVIVVHKILLGVSATNSCAYSPNDCFEDRTSVHNYCGGKTLCDLFPPPIPVNQCNNSRANYLYVEHQCIPTQPKLNLDICSSGDQRWRVEGGAMISLSGYTSEDKRCDVLLQSNKLLGSQNHVAFKIYILSLNLPIRETLREEGGLCSETDPYIDIDDHEFGVTRLCGSSHTRYLLETCSTLIEIRYHNIIMPADAANYTGFQIYFESVQNNECLATVAPPTPSPPFIVQNKYACALTDGNEHVDFSCTSDHGLVFLQSYLFVTKDPVECNISEHLCFYPSERPQSQCSGEQFCQFTHIIDPELNLCQGKQADAVEFSYQCLPMTPSTTNKYTFGTDTVVSGYSGFIETPHYPNTYQHGLQHSSITIRTPDNAENRTDSIYLYVFKLAIRDTSVINSSSPIHCYDSIRYTDGNSTHSLCGKIDQPILKYHTNKKELTLTLNISHPSSSSEWNTWHGARLFYYIGELSLPSPPMVATTLRPVTTTQLDETSTASGPGIGDSLLATIITLSILAALAVILGFAYYRRRSALRASQEPKIEYNMGMDTLEGITAHEETEKRSSIRTDSLKGPASSAFTNPLYKISEANNKQKIEDATDA